MPPPRCACMASLAAADIGFADLSDVALSLGADVPACLVSRPCEVRGVGEIIHPLRTFPGRHIVLVNPLQPVVTADVFRRLQSRDQSAAAAPAAAADPPGPARPLARPKPATTSSRLPSRWCRSSVI